MSLFAKRKKAEIAEATRKEAEADAALKQVQGRWSRVESFMNTVGERRKDNGFGDEYFITHTPRKSAS